MDGNAPEFIPALEESSTAKPSPQSADRGRGRGGASRKVVRKWWASIEEDDVISLEPISQLKYEPINIKSDDKVCNTPHN